MTDNRDPIDKHDIPGLLSITIGEHAFCDEDYMLCIHTHDSEPEIPQLTTKLSVAEYNVLMKVIGRLVSSPTIIH